MGRAVVRLHASRLEIERDPSHPRLIITLKGIGVRFEALGT